MIKELSGQIGGLILGHITQLNSTRQAIWRKAGAWGDSYQGTPSGVPNANARWLRL